jgi:hypothetical protein
MPTKSRKWLAGSVATALLASMFSMFTAVPASANGVVAGVSMTAAVSKSVRATDTITNGDSGVGVGTAPEDFAAVILTFDESSGSLHNNTSGDDSLLYVRMTSRPSVDASITFKSTGLATDNNSVTLSTLNTWGYLNDDSAAAGTTVDPAFELADTLLGRYTDIDGNTLAHDDTRIFFNFAVDEVGTYTLDVFRDMDDDGILEGADMVTTVTITAAGTPALTVSASTMTLTAGVDDTLTLTLTGGALSTTEEFWLSDNATMADVTFSLYRQIEEFGSTGPGTRWTSADDTMIIDDSLNWTTGSGTTTASLQVNPASSATDLAGTLAIWRKTGLVTPAAKATLVTFAGSTLENKITAITLTSPTANIKSSTKDADGDDTWVDGLYTYEMLKSATSVTVAGTFEVTGSANYGDSVTVALYGTATPTSASVALSSSSIATSTATGIGSFTFTVPADELDASDEAVTVVIGGLGLANDATSNTPKRIQINADDQVLTTNFMTMDGISFTSSTGLPTLVKAVGSSTSFTYRPADQWGTTIAGYKLRIDGFDRNGAHKILTSAAATTAGGAAVSLSFDDTGTAASTAGATAAALLTQDLINLKEVNNLGVVGSALATPQIAYAAPTLTGLLIGGYAPAAFNTEYDDTEPIVPHDGEAGGTATGGTDAPISVAVTSSYEQAAGVVFTGSAGVRFLGSDDTANVPSLGAAATADILHSDGKTSVIRPTVLSGSSYVATAYFFCVTAGDCTVTATQGAGTASGTVQYRTTAAGAFNVSDIKVNDVTATTGTAAADKKVKISFTVTDVFGNAVKTLGESGIGVDVMVSGVGSIDGLGSQGTLKTATNGTAQFFASSTAAGSMQIELDGSGAQFGNAASTALNKPASADKKTVTITWTAVPVVVPEVVYAAPTLTVTKSGNKIILDGTAVEGEGDIIVYIKRVGTTKWVEQAATIEVAAPGDYNGMRIAPKSNVLIRVKQEGTGKFSNQVVVLK